MKLKVNWNRFFMLFMLFECVFLLTGCTASWLTAISALLPAIESAVSAIVSFVLALEGKEVPASFVAIVQQVESDVSEEIANVQQLVAAYKAAASTGTISQIQAVFQAILTNLNTLLNDASITDQSTISTITKLVTLGVAAVNTILAFFPAALSTLAGHASKEDLEAMDRKASDVINGAHKLLQENYAEVVNTPTANPDVNAALATLPKSLP